MATATVRLSKALYQREYYRRNKDRCRAWAKDHRNRRNQALVRYKADTGCKICGEKDPDVLDFHHRDPSQKEFDLNSANVSRSEVAVEKELSKCDVLCANCHRRHEAGVRRGRRISNDEQPFLPFAC